LTQWITLFDDPDDDEYDGDFGEDDEENPMIRVQIKGDHDLLGNSIEPPSP